MKLEQIKKLLTRLVAPFKSTPLEEGEVSKRHVANSIMTNTDLAEVNIFPLRNAVLFPGGALPLHIFEDRYQALTEDSVKKQIPLAMSHEEGLEAVHPGLICGGGPVTVLKEFPDHRKNILVAGTDRFRVRKILQKTPFYKVLAERLEDIPFADTAAEARVMSRLETNVRRWIFANPSLEDGLMNEIFIFDQPHQLADFIGSHFLPTAGHKQTLLEESDRAKRVDYINAFLEDEVSRYEAIMSQNTNFYVNIPRSEMH